jgi:hypothetical protein
VRSLSLVPDGEPAEAEQPGDRPLDLPAVPAEPLARFDPGTRDARDEPSLAQPGEVFGGEIRLVRAEFDGLTPSRPAVERTAGIPRISGFRARLSWVFAPDTATASGMPWASDSTCSLLPFLPRSTGFGPVSVPPLLARTEAASTIAEAQSSSPRAPSSSRTARWRRRHSPARVHAVNRRCSVAGETPNVSGRCRQAHPLVSTYTTAVNTARSSHGAVPPPCGRELNDGSNGATSYGVLCGDRSVGCSWGGVRGVELFRTGCGRLPSR